MDVSHDVSLGYKVERGRLHSYKYAQLKLIRVYYLFKLLIMKICIFKNIRPPGHHLYEVNVGLFKVNSSVDESYVHVVSKPRIKVPWPSSV